ncbi:MAG: STAS domain-containing protein [Chloroflexaceae bacterium]|nr:STAS domain-containing protein [Chloroflexaceae bacterium]
MVLVLALVLVRRGRFTPAILIAIFIIIGVLGMSMLPRGTSSLGSIFFTLAIPIVLAGYLANRLVRIVVAVITVSLVAGVGFLESQSSPLVGYLMADRPGPWATVIPFSMMVGLLYFLTSNYGNSLRQALNTAQTREVELEQVRAAQQATIAEQTAQLREALRTAEAREAALNQTLQELQAAQATVRELSAPVIPVLPGVLIAPLIGSMDAERAAQFNESLLAAIQTRRARHVILDVTGLPVLDTQVAQALVTAAAAARLLGARVLLVGIRPEVAQTLVSLQVELSDMATFADLQSAIATLVQRPEAKSGKPGLPRNAA